ncbi:hypothetical protein J5N97_009729 [Dioscorea zingiberensis]|uniref:Uncharacterized protein n=1 Tax=Dioscorea zingiberensis TaxID=325984 RepID=A0A9D5CYW6_9LILI|nr:hypothetical protein J5N97_009729 [Dioscorea zingiberensis]
MLSKIQSPLSHRRNFLCFYAMEAPKIPSPLSLSGRRVPADVAVVADFTAVAFLYCCTTCHCLQRKELKPPSFGQALPTADVPSLRSSAIEPPESYRIPLPLSRLSLSTHRSSVPLSMFLRRQATTTYKRSEITSDPEVAEEKQERLYGECWRLCQKMGNINLAQRLFDEMPEKDNGLMKYDLCDAVDLWQHWSS